MEQVNPNAVTSDFFIGQKVKYVPRHANRNQLHKDCENGIVSSINDSFVFVIYYSNAKATNPKDLI